MIAGLAGLVAGAMSMAAGEYFSVSSQTDAEYADLARETRKLEETPEAELEELTQIHVERGLDRDLAEKVAVQLTERDALGSHARDELGISETVTARPIQAALVSALTFAVGAVVPLIVTLLVPETRIGLLVAASSIVGLAVLGGLGASVPGDDRRLAVGCGPGPRPSTPSTWPRSFTVVALGGVSRQSNMPRWRGRTGSTNAAFSN